MRFEHDTYDIDVYSLCESVYYSCNNDEYDYVLECINDWIYNDYNDNILLEDIVLNEMHVAAEYQSGMRYGTLDNHLRNFGINPKAFHRDQQKNEYRAYDKYDDRMVKHVLQVSGRESMIDTLTYLLKLGNISYDFSLTDSEMAHLIEKNRNKIIANNNQKHLYHPGRLNKLLNMIKSYSMFDKSIDLNPDVRKGQVVDVYKSPKLGLGKVKHNPPPVKTPEPLVPSTTATAQPDRKVETNTQQQETQPKPSGGNGTPPTPSRLSRATTWMKNNKGKTALGVGLGAAAIGGSIYAYKQYKNKPKSIIAKRIQALRGIYHKFMINAQRNPKKANIFKRIAAKILSVIDKLLHYLQNTADGR